MKCKRDQRCVLLITGMILVDLSIKLIIDSFFMEEIFLITEWLGFAPVLNTNQLSIFNNEMDLVLSIGTLVVLNIFLLVLFPFFWNWIKKRVNKVKSHKFLDCAAICFYAGMLCSFIDKIFWGGSLDYILIFNWIIDVKDAYLGLGGGFCLLAVIEDLQIR